MNKPTEPYCRKIEQAFTILGQRWNGLILHALLHGPKRFHDLEMTIPNISARMLTLRLKTLEQNHLIEKQDHLYCLTNKGTELNDVMESLRQWISKYE